MSGVSGSDRISRSDFSKVLKDYEKLISKFPGFVSIEPSGSYNSDRSKEDFGDMDLILTIKTDKDKPTLKKELADWFSRMNDSIIVPFTSDKYKGRKFYNSGEIITINYPQLNSGKTVQIDNVVALDPVEAKFKKDFLDMPAQKQGLVLGLMKVVLIENEPTDIFKKIGISVSGELGPNQEYEFNLSSTEIQLRRVQYEAGTCKQVSREIVWHSRDWKMLEKILYQFDIQLGFDDLVDEVKKKLKHRRSSDRMAGVFRSMISIKSGEVGTLKGQVKQIALDKVAKIFGEAKYNSFSDAYYEIY
jgi:hypothetical protein